jgi:nucleotide-binding universal stress UspA family protein
MYKRILAAVDGSETSGQAFDTALELARKFGAELQPLYIVDGPLTIHNAPGYDPGAVRGAFLREGTQVVNDALVRMRHGGVQAAPRIIKVDPPQDDIVHCILRAAVELEADLVVMGTHGRRGFREFALGTVAERFLRVAGCPVLMIPAHRTARRSARESMSPAD